MLRRPEFDVLMSTQAGPAAALFRGHRPVALPAFPDRGDLFGACAGGRGGAASRARARYYR
ncbi:hypothetical protein [Streptomyces sp. NPDC050392]|uniref:hypothetical protein n=1 Tax=Streptomyces sp. NPDC050392 TaxID=3155782 RepID=UPI00341C856A